MGAFIWLASYMKSGNTWMRTFLSNYLRDASEPVHINALDLIPWANSRLIFDAELGISSVYLSVEETDSLRPDVYRQQARAEDGLLFRKVHDAYRVLPDGQALFPSDVTKGVLYVLRNPLDVAVSLAAHTQSTLDRAIQIMADTQAGIGGGRGRRFDNQLRQHQSSWSQHIRSWVDDCKQIPVHIVRYEDMCLKTTPTFADVVRFLELDVDDKRLERALAFSSFDVLQAQEQADGFSEGPAHLKTFFRQGQVGDWRKHLQPEQVTRLITDHHDVMQRFGYLTADGEPVY